MFHRNLIIQVATFLGGLYFFLEFVLPGTILGFPLDSYHSQISDGFVTIGAMALGLGIINLLMVHGRRIVFRQAGTVTSLVLLLGLAAMLVVTSGDWWVNAKISRDVERLYVLRDFAAVIETQKEDADKPPAAFRQQKFFEALCGLLPTLEPVSGVSRLTDLEAQRFGGIQGVYDQEAMALGEYCAGPLPMVYDADQLKQMALHAGELGNARRELLTMAYSGSALRAAYALLYDGLFISLGSAMFSLLGFYIAAAAYRAFRVRSAESALMMLAALIVMLGQIPFGPALWEDLPQMRLWLLSVPSSGAFRAIKIGAAVAGLVLALRMWLSLDSRLSLRRGGSKT